jgi:hypothetical protein
METKMQMENRVASPLKRKATLVSVTCGVWSARKYDRKVTRKTNAQYAATDDAGRYNKLLIQKERLTRITSLATQARTLLYSMTQPWAQEGPRILPNVLYQKFANAFRDIKREFDAAADDFERDYPAYIKERRKQLNGMFDPADYPPESEIRSKFVLKFGQTAISDDEDFRTELDDEITEDIRAEIAANIKESVNAAKADTIKRVIEVVGHMANKLAEASARDEDDEERKFFKNSLVENVRELVELLPAFNLTNDPKLTKLTNRMAKELCIEDAKVLRDNPKARETVQKSAEEILATAEKFLA